MQPFKRALTYVCVWLGGNDPMEARMPSGHSWLVPGPSLLNNIISWCNPPQPILATVVARRPESRR
jgi:hypothetical protein